ncbi:MAG: RBBP9/YdeN family alpha/beta hydrolase [Hasllibacter sp.]
MSDPAVLTVPGLDGADPGHWMSLWERGRPAWRRAEPPGGDDPDPDEWCEALAAAVAGAAADGPVVAIAHGAGCLALARLAEARPAALSPVIGALLVAPPDAAQPMAAPALARLGTGPEGGGPWAPLPFPAVVAASQSDPRCAYERAAALAGAWGASLADMGAAGRLGRADGYGEWPEGEALLDDLIAAIRLGA